MTYQVFFRALGGLALIGALHGPALGQARTMDRITQRVSGLEHGMAQATTAVGGMRVAQLVMPPGDIPDNDGNGNPPPSADPGGLDVRVDRLENQMRTLNGQIEQNQFAIRQLQDQLKKFARDVDVRMQGNGRNPPPRHAQADDDTGTAVASVPDGLADPPDDARPKRTGDAFNPTTDPAAPGAPRPLGTPATASAPLGARDGVPPAGGQTGLDDPNGPLDLTRGANGDGAALQPPPPSPKTPRRAANELAATGYPGANGVDGYPGPPIVAPSRVLNAPVNSVAHDDFDTAVTYLRGGQYESAQTSFESFIQKYPKDKLVPDAVYYLGETYAQRGRHREAAEQYLKIATDYSHSPRAPEGMVKLGMSLNAIGAKEQACATFQEVAHKYPNASVSVRNNVDRELKRARC